GATHTVTPTQTTTYTVEGTTDGCSSTATASVIIKDNADCETGVKDIQAINLNIYPNPANTNVTVNGFDLTQYFSEYSIVDLTGRTISTQKVNSDELSIDVSKLVEGVYFINLNGTFHKAIMIEVKH